MEKASNSRKEMRPSYDHKGGTKRKFASRYPKGTNVVVLDPDVAQVFPNAKIVNRSLRRLAKTLDLTK